MENCFLMTWEILHTHDFQFFYLFSSLPNNFADPLQNCRNLFFLILKFMIQ